MEDAAKDMNTFLRVFFDEMFPQFSANPLHFAGESFGGHWVPSFVTHMAKRQELGVPGTFSKKFDSVVLLDPVISFMTSADGAVYDHFCSPESNVKFNETACEAMEKTSPECDYLDRQCVDTYDFNICKAAFDYCGSVHAQGFYYDDGPGMPDPYDDRNVCIPDKFACGHFDMGFVEYLNTPKVQRELGFRDFEYKVFTAALNRAWGWQIAVPTTRQMSYILDHTPTKALVVNGNRDALV